ncbi:hypothetical protein H6P81_001086 [Aristolochia fimbriata]|uniref:DUF547 domain-containing protein n=1 Tax=Aristolochia fimbriata TaxID=158543 RepID=A0AAV7F676_ARIFI|nr:hypothetical protein H6P81_001086 [Aristolochia fimbriata]
MTINLKKQKIQSRRMLGVTGSLPASYSSHHRRSWSTPENGVLECDLNMPKQKIPFPNTRVAELINEISILELEISNLERYLLSLYRTAFDQFAAKPNSSAEDKDFGTSSSLGFMNIDEKDLINRDAEPSHSLYCAQSEHSDDLVPETSQCVSTNLEKSLSSEKNSEPALRSLADHLGSSLEQVHETPNRLSEEILRCVSAIYCKLANAAHSNQVILSASPSPSVSSSSTFSPQYPNDIWSPRFDNESLLNTRDLEELKVSRGPYSGMVEVPRIRVDDERFHYAAAMFQSFKSLIQHLEKVDPASLKHEEKLAFWINIHNALMMHAYLAYGDQRNHLKSGSSNAKASYNIGGCLVNAFVIQNAILGCLSRRSSPWLRSFFSPGNKFRAGSGKHIYALDHPEPLVHFALCSGSYSDPAVRLYTGEGVMQELKLARAEFIRNSVHIHGDGKIILPKILSYYAKDAGMQLSSIMRIVHDCLPEAQQTVIQRSLQSRLDKYVEWTPYISAFRYLIHRELAEERTSICPKPLESIA